MSTLEKAFDKMGARVRVTRVPHNVTDFRRFGGRLEGNVALDIRRDKNGEFFDFHLREGIKTQVLDVRPDERHLLLMIRDPENPKARFLCGHDERHWFTAAIPEVAGASNVKEAKEALKPVELKRIERKRKVKEKDKNKRHRNAEGGKIHRQGEFTFVPQPNMTVKEWLVQKKEPLAQRGNPHVADFLYRTGGDVVYTHKNYPDGISVQEYNKLIRSRDENARGRWEQRTVGMRAYVKGRIRHSQHATIELGSVWHEVIVNTEGLSVARSFVTFMD